MGYPPYNYFVPPKLERQHQQIEYLNYMYRVHREEIEDLRRQLFYERATPWWKKAYQRWMQKREDARLWKLAERSIDRIFGRELQQLRFKVNNVESH